MLYQLKWLCCLKWGDRIAMHDEIRKENGVGRTMKILCHESCDCNLLPSKAFQDIHGVVTT
jgi:hypothetical protein